MISKYINQNILLKIENFQYLKFSDKTANNFDQMLFFKLKNSKIWLI